MAKSKTVKEGAPKAIKPTTVDDGAGVYIDPLTDFGFKRLFGDKELMMNFLNAVLDVKDGIVELHYGNTVRTGISKDDRTTIFDLYCTTGKGERIIVEMQTIRHDYYKDRALYYASRLIQEQAKKGKDWDFMLYPVYSVNILNFCLDKELKTKKYSSYIQLIDNMTNQLFYDKLTFIYLELPRFTKKENQLKDNVEQWMYALKYLPKLDKLPDNLRNEVFEKLFELARIAKMSRKQQNAYYKSVQDMSIIKNQFLKMESTISALTKDVSVLTQDNAVLTQNNAALQKKVEELQRKLRSSDKRKSVRTIKAKTKVDNFLVS